MPWEDIAIFPQYVKSFRVIGCGGFSGRNTTSDCRGQIVDEDERNLELPNAMRLLELSAASG
jgi:hypothetical protein